MTMDKDEEDAIRAPYQEQLHQRGNSGLSISP